MSKVGIFVDGVPVLKIGEGSPFPLVQYLALACHQLRDGEQSSFHLPDMPTRIARSILRFTQTTPTNNASIVGSAVFPLFGRLLEDIELYICLLQVDMHPTVLFATAVDICARFADEWRSLTQDDIKELDDLFMGCEALLDWSIPSFLQDPLFSMITHTFAYGVQEEQFPRTEGVKNTLQECCMLREAVIAVGKVTYAIRSLVASPTVHALPKRHRQCSQRASPSYPASSELIDLFPFNIHPAPSPSSWSPPMTITVRELFRLSLDVFTMGDVVNWDDEDGSAPSPVGMDGIEAETDHMEVENTTIGRREEVDIGVIETEQTSDVKIINSGRNSLHGQ